MQEFPREFKPYLGLGLILVGVLPLTHEIADGASTGSISLKALAGCGIFLLLGVILVLEAFLGRRLLMLMLFLFGWLFFSCIAYALLMQVAPFLMLFGVSLTTLMLVVLIGSVVLGLLGTIGYYVYQKRKPELSSDRKRRGPVREPLERRATRSDESHAAVTPTIGGGDQIKRAGESLHGLASKPSRKSPGDDIPPPAAR